MRNRATYIGIDPGVSGGVVVLSSDGSVKQTLPFDGSDFNFSLACGLLYDYPEATVCIEEQLPRPTRYFDKKSRQWISTILRSTCILYGSYQRFLGVLLSMVQRGDIALFDDISPQEWHKVLGLRTRRKGEGDAQWKNYIRGKAVELFPNTKITLKTADALLIAYYCYLIYSEE